MGIFTSTVDDHLIVPARVALTHGQRDLLHMAGRPIPESVTVRLVIDTGSKRSTLIPGIIDYLDPVSLGRVRVETAGEILRTALFWVRLEFPETGLAPFPEIAMARMKLPQLLRTFHGLIGRDLLRSWESFLYEGRLGRYTIQDFPGGPFGWLRSLFSKSR